MGYDGPRCLELLKLRQQNEDANKYRSSVFKVVAVHRNGTFQVFVPQETNLMTQWKPVERPAMIQMKDSVVISAFQNQAALSYIYILTLN